MEVSLCVDLPCSSVWIASLGGKRTCDHPLLSPLLDVLHAPPPLSLPRILGRVYSCISPVVLSMEKMRTRYCISAITAKLVTIMAASNVSEDAGSRVLLRCSHWGKQWAAAHKVKHQTAQRARSEVFPMWAHKKAPRDG